MAERLTIDKAIAHAREVARENKYRAEHKSFHRNDKDEISACLQCAEEHEQLAEWLKDLQHYKDLEEQGRLITLPCKIGDTVYSFSFNIVYPFTVNGFEINKDGVEFKGSYCGEEKSLEYWSIHFPVSKIGKAVFLTREEAEAALKGVEE